MPPTSRVVHKHPHRVEEQTGLCISGPALGSKYSAAGAVGLMGPDSSLVATKLSGQA